MNIEINSKAVPSEQIFGSNEIGFVLVTPPISEDYWLMRVQVSANQFVVIFPKFAVIGCGYQYEDEDWNTNLPLACPSEVIARHIYKNHRDASVFDTIQAIELLQEKCLEMGLLKQHELDRMGQLA